VRISVPRDRNSTFEPQIVAKRQRRVGQVGLAYSDRSSCRAPWAASRNRSEASSFQRCRS
jgi:hypothetical protein